MSCAVGFVPSIQPRKSQIARKSSMVLMSGVPVSAMNSARGFAARIERDSAMTCLLRSDFRFLMKCASSTTIPLNPNRESQPTWRSRIS